MSHVTADLEFFKCDLCSVYFHKDIFCDHRRDCKGLNSQELKKSECRKWEAQLSENTRRLLEEQDAKVCSSGLSSGIQDSSQPSGSVIKCSSLTTSNVEKGSISAVPLVPAGMIKKHLPINKLEMRRNERVRGKVADEYEAAKDKAFEKKYSEDRMKELMDFLNAEE